jgi:antitoxin component HigA of HigAB toxin-antitoxin module
MSNIHKFPTKKLEPVDSLRQTMDKVNLLVSQLEAMTGSSARGRARMAKFLENNRPSLVITDGVVSLAGPVLVKK